MKNKLTLKQRKFIKFYLQSGNVSKSALKAGYSLGVSGFENLQKPTVLEAIQKLQEKEGITDEYLIRELKQLLEAKKLHVCNIYIKDKKGNLQVNRNSKGFIEVDDNQTQFKALELLLKLKGKLKDHVRHSGEINTDERRIVIISPSGNERKIIREGEIVEPGLSLSDGEALKIRD